MESTEDDFSLELNIFIWNVNYKRLEVLLYLYSKTTLCFKNVQSRIDAMTSHHALQK